MTTEPIYTDAQIREWADRHDLPGTMTDLRCIFEDAASTERQAAMQGQGGEVVDKRKLIDSIKSASGYHLRDGTGASDAIYNLAVKHGANEIEAAGFSHHVNGAMNELQSCVYNMARLLDFQPPKPARSVSDEDDVGILRQAEIDWNDGIDTDASNGELMRLCNAGFLEAEQFRITKKGREAIDAAIAQEKQHG